MVVRVEVFSVVGNANGSDEVIQVGVMGGRLVGVAHPVAGSAEDDFSEQACLNDGVGGVGVDVPAQAVRGGIAGS